MYGGLGKKVLSTLSCPSSDPPSQLLLNAYILWSLLLWRYSRPAWTRSCAAYYCRWPCFGRGVGL